MDETLQNRILIHLDAAGYSEVAIRDGIAYADRIGFSGDDDALSIVVGHILYGENECNNGARFPVEHGSDW